MEGLVSECALRALGVFGLTTEDVRAADGACMARAGREAARIDVALRQGEIALIRGMSGSGKTSVLRALAERVACVWIGRMEDGERRVVDVLARGVAEVPGVLRALSAAGLADAFVPARRMRELSEGERARTRVAAGIMEAERRLERGAGVVTLVLDDFGDGLDEATAAGVCATVGRWVRGRGAAGGVRVVCATVRADVALGLRAEMVVDIGEPGRTAGGVEFGAGTAQDYAGLSAAHYRGGRPATVVGIVAARSEGACVGVLTVSMPTLNGAWRVRAWPELAGGAGRDKRRLTREINATVRCVSRVIVAPGWRGRGVGSGLVRWYLERALTKRTEAVSAMGAVSPLFERAGMRMWPLEPSARDGRLAGVLREAGMEPWQLADVERAVRCASENARVERALRVWARAHGHTRGIADGEVRRLVRAAAVGVTGARRAYTHG